jgi:hypothetical protein
LKIRKPITKLKKVSKFRDLFWYNQGQNWEEIEERMVKLDKKNEYLKTNNQIEKGVKIQGFILIQSGTKLRRNWGKDGEIG